MAVFVLDRRGKPLMPCSEKRARLLRERGHARVHRVVPYVIRLVDRTVEDSALQPLRLKLDPGSKTTGLALVREMPGAVAVLNLFELVHRGAQISQQLQQRRHYRRRRRAQLRYRAPRFQNRTRPAGWLAPSLRHRVDTTVHWVRRLLRWAPFTALSMELVHFDLQAMQAPDIEGIEYQQGTLAGYELRDFLRHAPARLAHILAQAKAPLKDAAAVNATRWRLRQELKAIDLPLETGSGGRTKYNRSRLHLPKSHALDAVCAGEVQAVQDWQRPALQVRCSGRGSYQRTRVTAHGFPRGYLMRQKRVHGFQTGDLVRAAVPSGKKAGDYVGRVAVRASGNFNIQTPQGVVQGISHRHCCIVQRADGYGYAIVPFRQEEAGR